LWSAAVLRRFPMLQKKLRTLCGLNPRSQTLVFAVWNWFESAPSKRQDTAALQNLAVILR
jgi:hypothetical protein